MPGLNQIVSPVPLSPARRETKLTTSGDLYASINATLASKSDRRPGSPLQEEYSVPAPPPPSPTGALAQFSHPSIIYQPSAIFKD
ncbi:unnamed protein product [Clonostachys rosea]|uniref:Uncharacterized protein n=1 Tax=Bionectria ochroleuca TaxID=29856 RepID=A0ABY6V3B7_BIOOC|nr:unnamed protein product [Clonostachys rosea]